MRALVHDVAWRCDMNCVRSKDAHKQLARTSLTYDEHITQLTSKCIGSLCQINRVKYLFDRRTLITIINSLVFSKLLYCSSVWANTTKKNIELLQTVQNFAARIVSGTRKFDHVTPMSSCSGCQLLNNLRLGMLSWYLNA